MRYVSGIVLLVFLLAPTGLPDTLRDLDVGVPPGTPIEWDKSLRQPQPTGGRGRVPVATTDKKPEPPPKSGGGDTGKKDNSDPKSGNPNSGGQKSPGQRGGGFDTIAEERVPKPPNFDYGATNLYDFFRVTTHDIMKHVSLNVPKGTGKVTQEDPGSNDVATGPGGGGGGGPSRVTWNYPPEVPVELVWMACMACIRTDVHPEVVSEPESIVYCVELGIPAKYGAKAYQGKIGTRVQQMTMELPPQPPDLVGGKNPYESMLARLAVVELSSGFAYALDPNFARRTLALGEDSYRPVLSCAKSRHPLLAENATAVLSNFSNQEVNAELKKIFENNPDVVCKFRALTGLLRRNDQSLVPPLIAIAKGADEVMRCYAIYALGLLGDPKASPIIRGCIMAAGTNNKDLLWSALPAMARLKDKSKDNLELARATERALRDLVKGDDKVQQAKDAGPGTMTPTAEAQGCKLKILRQMALLALAAQEDPDAMKEVLDRVEKGGVSSFHQAVWFLIADVLVGIGDKGVALCKNIVDGSSDDSVRVHALRVLGREQKVDTDYLKGKANGGSPVVRATAIQMLSTRDAKACAEVCRTIVSGYAGGSGAIDGAEAFVVAQAAQSGGKVHAWTDATIAADLVKATERAHSAGAFARREGENDPDITKCKISIYPPLLETVIIECGRGGGDKAVAALIKILKDEKKTPGRGEAALALGAIGGKEAIDALLAALDDKDGWVRFCAYLSCKRQSGQDFFMDWIFGAESGRKPCIDKYKEWFNKNSR